MLGSRDQCGKQLLFDSPTSHSTLRIDTLLILPIERLRPLVCLFEETLKDVFSTYQLSPGCTKLLAPEPSKWMERDILARNGIVEN